MWGAVLYGPRDIRFVEREDPKIVEPTDALLRLSATGGPGRFPRASEGFKSASGDIRSALEAVSGRSESPRSAANFNSSGSNSNSSGSN